MMDFDIRSAIVLDSFSRSSSSCLKMGLFSLLRVTSQIFWKFKELSAGLYVLLALFCVTAFHFAWCLKCSFAFVGFFFVVGILLDSL